MHRTQDWLVPNVNSATDKTPALIQLETHEHAQPPASQGSPGAVMALWKGSLSGAPAFLDSLAVVTILEMWPWRLFCHVLMDFVPDMVGRNLSLSSGKEPIAQSCSERSHLFNYMKKVLGESMIRNENPRTGGKI